ncbi:MAG: hypothetical protein H7101_12695 [Deinococcales bacterium]|nr:hypothetical protein [Chitinophagaceae bacterium]
MNDFIERVNRLPFSVLNSLQINIVQTMFLYVAIIGVAWWLYNKKPKALLVGLTALLFFLVVRYWDFMGKNQQQQLVVYHVPQHAGIDIMQGRQYMFVGDSVLQDEGFLRNFHLQPSRVLHRIAVSDSLTNISVSHNSIISTNKTVIIIDKPLPKYHQGNQKITADVVILSKNPKLYFSQLIKIFNCKQYVFDASNPTWKINFWKKDADSLGLQYHDVAKSGAFVMGL